MEVWKDGRELPIIVKSKNMFTVRQRTNTPPPLARIVSSPLCWCISNYGFYYNMIGTFAFSVF